MSHDHKLFNHHHHHRQLYFFHCLHHPSSLSSPPHSLLSPYHYHHPQVHLIIAVMFFFILFTFIVDALVVCFAGGGGGGCGGGSDFVYIIHSIIVLLLPPVCFSLALSRASVVLVGSCWAIFTHFRNHIRTYILTQNVFSCCGFFCPLGALHFPGGCPSRSPCWAAQAQVSGEVTMTCVLDIADLLAFGSGFCDTGNASGS